MRIPASGGRLGRLARLALVPAAGLLLAACGYEDEANNTGDKADPALFGETANGIGFPHEVVTTEGIASASLYLWIFLIAVVIFIIVEGLLLFISLRFRRKGTDGELPTQTHGSNKLEIAWTLIPAVIVAVLFVVSTMVLVDVESKSEEPAVVVDVTAFRYGWIFDYRDPASLDPETGTYQAYEPPLTISGGGREGAPEMVLPVDRPVRIRLTAADVIHSFYVPSFFFKRDAFPGRVNEFELTIEQAGVYGGQCAEFCGLAHGDMYFTVNAKDSADYDAWLNERLGGTPATAEAGTADEEMADEEMADEEPDEPDMAGPEPAATDESSEEAA